MTFSAEHQKLMRETHETDSNFGVIGHLWAPRVFAYMKELGLKSMLDYGCGRANLAFAVAILFAPTINQGDGVHEFNEYDPATKPQRPHPAEFVTVIDVLEHVEVEQLQAVLDDISRCMEVAGLVTVSLRKSANSKKHPLVKPREWWLEKFAEQFASVQEVPILDPSKQKSELAVFVRPK